MNYEKLPTPRRFHPNPKRKRIERLALNLGYHQEKRDDFHRIFVNAETGDRVELRLGCGGTWAFWGTTL